MDEYIIRNCSLYIYFEAFMKVFPIFLANTSKIQCNRNPYLT